MQSIQLLRERETYCSHELRLNKKMNVRINVKENGEKKTIIKNSEEKKFILKNF